MNILRIRNELRNGKSIFDIPLRVTFYARVSTDKEEQLNSLENQVQYFTEFIRSRPNWTYVEGYVDEGISGASTKKRDNFLRMIADAKAGLFDFIITKEISRFSRSTLDSIEGVISTVEFKQRNDGFNQQIQALGQQLAILKAEEEKSLISTEQLNKIKATLEDELSFQNEIRSELVTTILDHIVVKKGSTKEEFHLDIYLKFGDPCGVIFDRANSSFCFTCSKSITHKMPIKKI